MDAPPSLTATIIHVTNTTAQLELALPANSGYPNERHAKESRARQRLEWPANLLPPGLTEGDTVTIQVLSDGLLEAQSQQQARVLLSELLGSRP